MLPEPSMKSARFAPIEQFRSRDHSYRLLPFRFERFDSDQCLAANEVGEYLWLKSEELNDFVNHELKPVSPLYADLKSRHFLLENDSSLPIELLASKLRSKKEHLRGFTKLHIFVVTLRCDTSCQYCQVSRVSADRLQFDMSEETATRSLELMFRSPADRMKLEIQGGEPLLNFGLVRNIVEQAEEMALRLNKTVDFVVASNLSLLNEEMLSFLRDHKVALSTSLDGPDFIHNANRPHPSGDGHGLALKGIEMARRSLGHEAVSALMTTSRLSLNYPVEIVEEYERLGFSGIFLRHASPYGFANRTRSQTGCTPEEFVEFYKRALDHILHINRTRRPFTEFGAQIMLRKILTPWATGFVDLQSPSGLGIATVVYNYNGKVYASDESRMLAEMGNDSFALGSVHDNTYEEIFLGERLQEIVRDSIIESLPGCSECAFLPYCGADPVRNLHTQGDMVGYRPTNAFHVRNSLILSHLMRLLRDGEKSTVDTLWSWATYAEPDRRDDD